MRGEALAEAELGWHGLVGDRRVGVRRLGDRGGFPWLTASRLPDLLRFAPEWHEPGNLPSHVRTPDGASLLLFGTELAAELARRHGAPVELVHLDRGIFDEASVSIVSESTVAAIAALANVPTDVRRFRPNLLLATDGPPFAEDGLVGGVLTFGAGPAAPAVCVTNPDERCAMVNFDPDSAQSSPEVLKAIVRERGNRAGVYATVIRRGRLQVGQTVYFEPAERT